MKIYLFAFLTFTSFNLIYGQDSLNGLYVGVEQKYWTEKNGKKIIWKDDERPKHIWYSLSSLKLKGDSVFLDQSPVSIYKTDTVFSASDGGFFYYSGTFTKKGPSISINLTEISCDYCGQLMKKDSTGKMIKVKRTKQYSGRLTDEGIVINGFLFKLSQSNQMLISENPSMFLKAPQ